MGPSISAVILTHNSARMLEPVLQALTWCSEIVIVDSGSTDATLEIAARFQAKVTQKKLDQGFGEQKRFAVSCASNDWVFVVDSDEIVSPGLAAEIRSSPFTRVGYKVHRPLIFLGHRLKFSGTQNDWQLRLFDRRRANFNSARVHEDVVLSGGENGKQWWTRLAGELDHYSYPTLEDYFAKFNRYTSLAAEELKVRGSKVSFFKIWTAFPATFIKLYFLKLGVLDGFYGFLWCLLSAVSPVVKYQKFQQLGHS